MVPSKHYFSPTNFMLRFYRAIWLFLTGRDLLHQLWDLSVIRQHQNYYKIIHGYSTFNNDIQHVQQHFSLGFLYILSKTWQTSQMHMESSLLCWLFSACYYSHYSHCTLGELYYISLRTEILKPWMKIYCETYAVTSAMCMCLILTQSKSSSFSRTSFSEPSLDLYLDPEWNKTTAATLPLTWRQKGSRFSEFEWRKCAHLEHEQK